MQMLETTETDERFQTLCRELDEEYFQLFGEQSLKYKGVNQIEDALAVVLAMEGEAAVGCGCIRSRQSDTVEIKRVLVKPELRRQGIGESIVAWLEAKAKSLGFTATVLETGKEMPWAIALYEKLGYRLIPNYGSFEGDGAVICMKKTLE